MFKVWNPRHWSSRLALRYVAIIFIVLFLMANVALWYDSRFWDGQAPRKTILRTGVKHPIRKLMVDAKARHDALLAKRTYTVEAAAVEYRKRRQRHPPPGFDDWFHAAMDTKAVVVEEYFDRIYKDLTPFWALEPEQIRKRANAWHHVVKVRNGTARGDGDVTDRVPWLKLWTDLVAEFAEYMPDVDMPINYMDEPRLLVPHDTIAKLVEKEGKERQMVEQSKVTNKFKGLAAVDAAKPDPYDPKWYGPSEQYWNLFVKTCGPDTPAFGVQQLEDLSGPAEYPQNYRPKYAYKGYIQNFTASTDPCLQPHLRQLHGSFIEPISLSSAEELIPLFGGSKLPMNNEILIPGAMYLDQGDFYSGGESHGPSWDRKKDGVIWRGEGSGGRAKEHNWQHFQRQRLVHLLNGTVVSEVEKTGARAKTFELPSQSIYPSPRLHNGNLGPFAKEIADTAFVGLCNPKDCPFYYDTFSVLEHLPMKSQYEYKFLPDVDGNSFSARFRGFLRSTSLPLKTTIYAEWHDDRLAPWVHFVPFDNTYRDLYPLLDYFSDNGGQGDTAARFIAEQGQSWSEQVLRRDDMRLYVWRLLLEWARVCDENRHTLGYVGDLKQTRKWRYARRS
ncbi:endoplasmic reticulum-resident kdel protein [Pochonia chlamydosporia 170]|uniref:Endoplasmic reticulum-resident kdel protein n=1 Tax=Pochonia chlamydosporia 170 TaxID=1380566 RepID=A0A179G416_METCM|nr:endoplasmic reticulum-resident kdel protein [Pochonia chlamydosporia 170]OAQ72083.1 endoplasmic reticulum-resident kdel protein [Pochonia chlamydosporia 170]